MRELVVRDWKSRYAGSLLGFLWAFAHPIAQLVLFTFVFSIVLRSPVAVPGPGFAAFLFCGLLPWMGVHEGIQRGTTAVVEGAFLLRKHSFPAEAIVIATVLSAAIQQLIATGIFVAIAGAAGWMAGTKLAWLPLAVVAQLVLTTGLSLLLAAAQVFFRDTAQVVSLVLMFWFYTTPIIYPSAAVPQALQAILRWNPLVALVEAHRWILLSGQPPSSSQVAVLFGAASLALGLGLWVFRNQQPTFADEL